MHDIEKTDTESATVMPPEAATRTPHSTAQTSLRVAVSAALVVILLGSGYAIFDYLIAHRPTAEKTASAIPPPLVEIQTLAVEDVKDTVIGYGSARADRRITLAAEVGGLIVHVPDHIKDGAAAKQGETLVRIDDRQYRRRLDKAESDLADVEAQSSRLDVEKTNIERLIEIAEGEVRITQAEYDRLSKLHEKKHASKKEWDFARLALQSRRRELQKLENERNLMPTRRSALAAAEDARKADIALARLDVERCTIAAPFSGQIDRVMIESGDFIQPGGQLVDLVDTRRIEIPVELPLSDRPRTKPGGACVLTMDSMTGVRWEATVKRLSPVADTQSRTFIAYLEVDNDRQTTPLVPGYFLTARIEGPTIRDAIVLPRDAIVRGGVFVVGDGVVETRAIHVERFVGERAVVSGELTAGDRVILTNLDLLYDGVAVRWRDRSDAADPHIPELARTSGE